MPSESACTRNVLPNVNEIRFNFDSFTAAIASLSLYTASHVTEITTAEIRAVPNGQIYLFKRTTV